MKQLFATFSEDDEEQKQLNIEAAKRSVNKTEAEKKLLIDEGYDDFVRGGKTASPVGDILGVGGGIVASYAAVKNPIMALSIIGAPNPNSPTFMDELSMEMVTQKGLPGNPIKGAKRIANLVSEIFPDQVQSSGRFFNQLFQKPNFVKQAEEVFSGRLFGVTGGSLNPPSGTNKQLRTLFNWETDPNVLNRPQAGYNQTVTISPRKVPRGVSGRMTRRKLNQFTKVETLDLQNGFTPTKQHANFTEYI